MRERRIIFFNRFFFPDHSATAQMLSDLAFHLAENGHRVLVVTSSGLYDDPSARLPSCENIKDVEIHRVYKPRFGRTNLVGRSAVDTSASNSIFASVGVAKMASRILRCRLFIYANLACIAAFGKRDC
jgi:colanic acid biosynthesis glycosyl transferase WcaI